MAKPEFVSMTSILVVWLIRIIKASDNFVLFKNKKRQQMTVTHQMHFLFIWSFKFIISSEFGWTGEKYGDGNIDREKRIVWPKRSSVFTQYAIRLASQMKR